MEDIQKVFELIFDKSEISINEDKIAKFYQGRSILITGAAGSIGSEIAHQVNLKSPEKIVLLDQAESPLFEIHRKLKNNKSSSVKIFPILANITDYAYMNYILVKYKPEIIIHCAAYKHVPILENQPDLAIKNNIFGTKTIADLAIKHKVKRFINISSDKAVNPTNVMGATKRFSEIYIHSLSNFTSSKTEFISTRFGNVIGSNGSVIPVFLDQIKNGGPVTVTHPEVTRYFMTIKEACRLVLEASVSGKNGEVFVFDMGDSIKIKDIASKLIEVYGNASEKEIKIEFTGLRPGEKLFEELLTNTENLKKTDNKKLFIADVKTPSHEKVIYILEKLKNSLNYDLTSLDDLVGYLKELIPEYKSENSTFSKLDNINNRC